MRDMASGEGSIANELSGNREAKYCSKYEESYLGIAARGPPDWRDPTRPQIKRKRKVSVNHTCLLLSWSVVRAWSQVTGAQAVDHESVWGE